MPARSGRAFGGRGLSGVFLRLRLPLRRRAEEGRSSAAIRGDGTGARAGAQGRSILRPSRCAWHLPPESSPPVAGGTPSPSCDAPTRPGARLARALAWVRRTAGGAGMAGSDGPVTAPPRAGGHAPGRGFETPSPARRWARPLAAGLAAACLVLPLAAFLATPAQAQTPTVWSATLTVGSSGDSAGYCVPQLSDQGTLSPASPCASAYGSVSDDAYIPDDDVWFYIVKTVKWKTNGRAFRLRFSQQLPAAAVSSLTLMVGTHAFRLSDAATTAGGNHQWDFVPQAILDLADGEAVPVKLLQGPPPSSIDTTSLVSNTFQQYGAEERIVGWHTFGQ